MNTCPNCGVEILEHPANECLDKLILEKVFGYIKLPFPAYPEYQKPSKNGVDCAYHINRYSTDIKAVWDVVNKLTNGDAIVDVCINPTPELGGKWLAMFIPIPQSYDQYIAFADTTPLAICRAALLTVPE